MAKEFEGLDTVMGNLNKEIDKIAGATRLACVRAGFFVEAQATRNAPLDTGNLRGSGYTRAIPDGAEVGFEADYALAVHEIDKNYTVGGWKYLQRVIDEDRDQILQIIRDGARV